MKKRFYIGLQFFGEGGDGDPPNDTPPPTDPAAPASAQVNYGEIFSNDGFRSLLSQQISSAVSDIYTKQQKLHDDKTSEAEKLKTMTADERAGYFQKKYEDAEKSAKEKDEAVNLRKETEKIFSEKKIPTDFLDTIDYTRTSAEQINSLADVFSRFEYHKTGEFEAEVTRRMNEALKQTPPKNVAGSGNADLETFNKMNATERMAFKIANPEKYNLYTGGKN